MCLTSNMLLSQTLKLSEGKSYDSEFDDETSVIFDICNIFEQTRAMKFVVSGFGQNKWPVDCKFELPGIMEDLPQIISKIKQGDYNFKLNFYEQGVEREIVFEECGENVSLTCLSNTNWIPVPSTIEMTKREVERVLESLYKDFISYSTKLCNNLLKHPLLSDWLNLFDK